MMLKPKEFCPIHRNFTCACHRMGKAPRTWVSKWETVRPGVRRIKDQFADHPDGYRYKLSSVAMRQLLLKKIREKNECCICLKPFETMDGIVPEHRNPKGMGGARRDDRESNIGPAHSECNMDKGSKRL